MDLDRLKNLGIEQKFDSPACEEPVISDLVDLVFYRVDLENKKNLYKIFQTHEIQSVCNLGAQAGVRYSISNPDIYIKSNIIGFHNILECCRYNEIRHLCFASSSSVYGLSTDLPYSVNNSADHPVSLYAATKRSNELLAHSYAHLYSIPMTGLRFFTVYGPWGRPDMAYYKFTDSIFKGKTIELFNEGRSKRDFTYIDDVVKGLFNALRKPTSRNQAWDSTSPCISSSSAPYEIYNIGNDSPVKVSVMIKILEELTGKELKTKLLPLQPGDVYSTHADIKKSKEELNFYPSTSLEDGLKKFVDWYKKYNEIA